MAVTREHAALLYERLIKGDRAALGRALTLVESALPGDQIAVSGLLDACMRQSPKARRLAVTGLPGAGKSTLIDRLGMKWVDAGHRVAVLAIDPSSVRTGGSILGDKTRMERLSTSPNAFIRPSPTSGMLGGIAGATRESMLVCAAAGYDVLIVETVGIGQSETAVADLVECVLMVSLAGGGDGLQGIKRGILEVADIVAVNKADGDNVKSAEASARGLKEALHLMRPDQDIPVLSASAVTGTGIDDIFGLIQEYWKRTTSDTPARSWMTLGDAFTSAVRRAQDAALQPDGLLSARLAEYRKKAESGTMGPWAAAMAFVRSLSPAPQPPGEDGE